MSNQPIKNTTRGGQVFLHNLRMISQVIQKAALWLLPVGVLAVVGWFFLITPQEVRWLGRQVLWAEFHMVFNGSHFRQTFIYPNGQIRVASVEHILSAPLVKERVAQCRSTVIRSMEVRLAVWFLSLVSVLVWLRKRGEKATTHQSIKGDQLGDVDALKRLLRSQRKTSDLVFWYEQLPLPLSSELQHLLVHKSSRFLVS